MGSPREIYDHPAERFVANFIGDTNFLSVEVIAVGEEDVRIKLPSGKTIDVALPEGGVSTGPTTVVIRPEHVRLTKAASEAAVSGTLDNIVYIGTDTQYHLRLADGTPFTVRMQNRRNAKERYSRGDELGIGVTGDAVQVLRD